MHNALHALCPFALRKLPSFKMTFFLMPFIKMLFQICPFKNAISNMSLSGWFFFYQFALFQMPFTKLPFLTNTIFSEVEFVTPVTAGGSVKYLPVVGCSDKWVISKYSLLHSRVCSGDQYKPFEPKKKLLA